MRVEWSPLAVERIGEISEYINRDSPFAADAWIEAIFEKASILKEFPNSGRVVPEILADDIRELIYGNYRIIYKVSHETVSVLTVRHTRQILPIEETNA